jgi:X-X-X-Leu-X-X-Gly heptad repeat protein
MHVNEREAAKRVASGAAELASGAAELASGAAHVASAGQRGLAPLFNFVDFFAEGWAIGATDPERFYAHFGARTAPDAPFRQPLAPTHRGPEGLRSLLKEGMIAGRRAHFDPLPLLARIAKRPRLALKLLPPLIRR